MSKIYTRTGDKGKTSLFNGKRVSKSNVTIEVLGSLDELNSFLGVIVARIKNRELRIKEELIGTQKDLMGISSVIANMGVSSQRLVIGRLIKRVKEFENLIDDLTGQMSKLSNFILPGGGKTGSLLHFTRTVCRRAERRVVELANKETINNGMIVYLNRLSDLLFTMARFVNFKEKIKEEIWVK